MWNKRLQAATQWKTGSMGITQSTRNQSMKYKKCWITKELYIIFDFWKSAIINTHMKSSIFHLWRYIKENCDWIFENASFSFVRAEKQNVLLLINNCKLSSAAVVNGRQSYSFYEKESTV